MALRLPTQVPPRRTTSYSHSQPSPGLSPSAPAQLSGDHEESTQWVVFSPSQPPTIAPTRAASTERATGISRLSDFESFGGTQTRSVFELGEDDDEEVDEVEEEVEEQERDNNNDDDVDEQGDDGTELDSLDDGLHAFRAPSLADDEPSAAPQWDQDRQGTPAVLPTHDGLGSFQASSQTVQDQLWQHEQFNPQRRPELRLRRRSSVQRHLDMVAEQEQMTNAERERWQRIEKWRMEQSRLLQEVERETRRRWRRRYSRASRMSEQTASTHQQSQHRAMPSESLKSVPETASTQPSQASSESTEPGSDESLWKRITRKVIRDLMGIDDTVLSVIFGESLPDDPLNQEFANAMELDSYGLDDQNQWQPKLLQRIARELGVLVHQLCEHPGAFTTYLNMSNQIGSEYAGIPLDHKTEEDTQTPPSRTRAPSTSLETTNNDGSMPSPHFSPTLPEPSGREHAAQWGIEEDDDRIAGTSESRLQQEKDYWESDLDVMMVFRYLRNRFGRSGNTTNNGSSNSSSTTTTAPSSTTASRIFSHRRQAQSQDASRRAALIRQHHPLVAHAHSCSEAQTRRQSQHSAAASAVPSGTRISSPILRQNFRRRPSSSCASHSAKMSTISSRRTMTGSSRNYWDIGGSVDGGSAIAPVGGMGAWGDV